MYSVALLVAMVASYLSLNSLSLTHFLIFIKSCDPMFLSIKCIQTLNLLLQTCANFPPYVTSSIQAGSSS